MPDEEFGEQELKIVSKHEFYFETPLYDEVSTDVLEEEIFAGDVDAYSAVNSTETTYAIDVEEVDVWIATPYARVGFFWVTLTCKRKTNDVIRFFLYKDRHRVFKVGQYPSLADLQFAEIGKKYDKVLPGEDLKNLKKAIGLAAHGAGAGSFVYLRRIFENLIFDTFGSNMSTLGVSEADFKKQRMEDKVQVLKDFLPTQLLEMKSVYSILSRGVHELSEEECMKYFVPLKLSIELILDQKIENSRREERDKLVKQQLQDISKELGKA